MSDVTLSVGGRKYTVSCADGQEDHVRHLASIVDGKLDGMKSSLSHNEAKNLLFAGLLLADELEDARKQTPAAAEVSFDTERVAGQLERLASALENAASTLESGTHSS